MQGTKSRGSFALLAFFQRYRELLLVAVLLLLPAGTYVANAKQGRDLSALDKFCLAVSAPVARAVDGHSRFDACWRWRRWRLR